MNDFTTDTQVAAQWYASKYYGPHIAGRVDARRVGKFVAMGHPLYALHRSALENRIESELAADRLARVLGMPCYVVFDSLTGYNHVVAGDCLDQWDGDDQRVVYTTKV